MTGSESLVADRRFRSPDAALLSPRAVVRFLVKHRKRLGLPEPDRYWQTTAQVNWNDAKPASFLVRVWCLYAGHDMRRVKVRERNGDWRIQNTDRLDCARCGWEGPWL